MSHSLLYLWSWYKHQIYIRIQSYFMGDNKGFLFSTGAREDRVIHTPGAACDSAEILKEDPIVTRVDWGKRKVTPYHEYLVVYIQERKSDGSKPRKSAVMIEHEVSNLVVEDEDPKAPPTNHPNLIFWKNGKQVAPPIGGLVRP